MIRLKCGSYKVIVKPPGSGGSKKIRSWELDSGAM